jgi:ATP-binding cassette, subfamily B, bacterial MsbA
MSSEPQAPPSPVPFRRLWGLVRPYLRPLLLATALLLVGSGVGLVAPRVAGIVVDVALLREGGALLNRVVLLLLGLFALMGALSFARSYLLDATGARLLVELRDRLFAHLVRLTPGFYETRRVGELISRLGSDLTLVQQTLTRQVPAGLQASFSFLGTLVVLLVLHTRLTLVTLAVIPPVILLAVWFGQRFEKLATRVQDALAETQAVTEEALSGLRTVQAFGREDHEVGRYGLRLGGLLTLELRNARLLGAFGGLMTFAAFSAFTAVLWYGGLLIQRGELTAGELTSFLLYSFSIATSVGTLGGLYAGYKELKGASARVFELLDTEPAITDPPDPVPLGERVPRLCQPWESATADTAVAPAGRVAFDHVSFSYPSAEGRLALADVDFAVEPGETVALVGPSGAGKTTLFALLLRFHDPTAGAVRLDGHDLRKLRLEELRRAVGLVPQDIFLFSDTIEANLRYGRPEATAEQVRAAAVAAGADGFIRALPKGYDEVVGERGVRLSSGQRQRIAIARAFLRDPVILLLDEATSALDAESEEVIQRALGELMAGRTTLVIAHRLATARRARRIFVLDAGRVVASGSHDELFAASTLYRRYWELQSLAHQESAAERGGTAAI